MYYHPHMTPLSRCLMPPFLPFEWMFMHLLSLPKILVHLGVVARRLVKHPLHPDPTLSKLSKHNYLNWFILQSICQLYHQFSSIGVLTPTYLSLSVVGLWSFATWGITPFWIFYFILSNMCRQTLHLMLTWNLLRTDGNVTVQSKIRYLHRYQTTVCHVLTNLNNISSWKGFLKCWHSQNCVTQYKSMKNYQKTCCL